MTIINTMVNGGWFPLLLAVMITATLVTILLPYFSNQNIKQRVKIVTREVDDLRKFERKKLVDAAIENQRDLKKRVSARNKNEVSKNIENLAKFSRVLKLERQKTDKIKMSLIQAGYRREEHIMAFLGARVLGLLIGPFVGYILVLRLMEAPMQSHYLGGLFIGGLLGFFLPAIILTNKKNKRQEEITLRFPDALDLLVVCVQSGMTAEAAIRRVSKEFERNAPVLCEEFNILGAELNYLKDRRTAFQNFAERVGVEKIKDFANTIIQAEIYGTSVLEALRVQSDELRNDRTQRAENKANSLPAKLTLPLALFMLPVVFVIILTPPLSLAFRSF